MFVIERNVTIYIGTKKRLAKRYAVEEPAFSMKSAARVRFMEKGARTRWWVPFPTNAALHGAEDAVL
jgi:hypothetical protein